MQTFSGMQRSISDKKSLAPFVYTALFVVYIGLSSVYLFLPPMLGVLFVLFYESLKDENSTSVLLICLCLLFFEADKGYAVFTSIVYFIIMYRFVAPKLQQNFNCTVCINFLYIVFVYVGFYFFSVLLANIFLLNIPNITQYVIYYIIIEFLIVSLL